MEQLRDRTNLPYTIHKMEDKMPDTKISDMIRTILATAVHNKKTRRPKVESQCQCCKPWGHEATHCDNLVKTMFVIDYAKKHGKQSEKVCEAFCKKNSHETQALIKTLKALPN